MPMMLLKLLVKVLIAAVGVVVLVVLCVEVVKIVVEDYKARRMVVQTLK